MCTQPFLEIFSNRQPQNSPTLHRPSLPLFTFLSFFLYLRKPKSTIFPEGTRRKRRTAQPLGALWMTYLFPRVNRASVHYTRWVENLNILVYDLKFRFLLRFFFLWGDYGYRWWYNWFPSLWMTATMFLCYCRLVCIITLRARNPYPHPRNHANLCSNVEMGFRYHSHLELTKNQQEIWIMLLCITSELFKWFSGGFPW